MTATALLTAIGDAGVFRNGRECAAWLGLVPRQHSTGGKARLLGISKRGDRYLRCLLIHGARSVVRRVDTRQDTRSQWLQRLLERRHRNVATVALANRGPHCLSDCEKLILSQSGWRRGRLERGARARTPPAASTAFQRYRTHQASAPLFRPVATDVKSEWRFIATIARRLDSLGAITRGQRDSLTLRKSVFSLWARHVAEA